jgi:hypothetical protein
LNELSLERRTGYGYETDIANALNAAEKRYLQVIDKTESLANPNIENTLKALSPKVQQIVKDQDELGRWIVKNDKFRKGVPGYQWQGEYRYKDRISSALFNQNVAVLCEFLKLYKEL